MAVIVALAPAHIDGLFTVTVGNAFTATVIVAVVAQVGAEVEVGVKV